MSEENGKKYDFDETDRVMAELKARLAADAKAPETEEPTKEAAPAEDAAPTAPVEEVAVPVFEEEVPEEADAVEENAPKAVQTPVEDTAAPVEPSPAKPPLQELSYAHRGNVFAPFGFVGDRPAAEEEPPVEETSAEKEPAAPAAAEEPTAPVAPEKPHKENKVFAPFGLKDTKIEATGLRAKAAEERAAREAAEAERTAREAAEAEAKRQAAEAAHKAEVITPTEVDYAQRGKVFAPFGFDPNAGKPKALKPEPEATPVAEAAPVAGEPAPVAAPPQKAEKPAEDWVAAPAKRGKRKKRGDAPRGEEQRTVEPPAPAAVEAEPDSDIVESVTPKKQKKPQKVESGNAKAAEKPQKVGKKPKTAPKGETPAIHVVPNSKAARYASGEDDVTLQCGGQTVVIPEDTDQFFAPYTKRVSPAFEHQNPNATSGELFSALSVTRPQGGAKPRVGTAKVTAEQMAFKRSVESSEEDFQLLLGLDYEKELGTAIGYEKIREYHERGLNGSRRENGKKQRGKKRFEYGSHAQDIGIVKHYAKKRRRLTLNLVVSLALLLLLFVYERLSFMHRWFGGEGAARYPALYVLLGLLIFSVGVILLRRQLWEGFMQMVRLAPTDHSLCSVTVLLTYLYHLMLFFLPREGNLSLYLSPAACSMMLLALASLMDGHRESAAFRVVSSKQQKYALLTRVSVGNSDGGAADRLMRSESREEIYYARPVDFVRNYFTNTEKKPAHNSFFGSLLLLILSIGIALALYVGVMGAAARTVVHTAFVTVMLCLPALSVLITALPMFLASLLRLKRRGAIIGEETVYQTPASASLVLPEEEVFLPMHHEQFELKSDADTVRGAVLIRALLERLDSPMVESVSVDPAKRLSASAVTLTEIEDNGVSAVVIDAEGKRSTLLFGGVAYLEKYGIKVSTREEDHEDLCKRLLCASVDGQLTALFLARYRLHGEILPLVNALAAENVTLVVRTKDPGVHQPQLDRLTVDAANRIRVTKPLTGELDLRADRVDATIVALGSGREVARTYATCRLVRRAGSFGGVLQILSTLFGVVLCGTLAFFGLVARIPAFAVTGYMLLWCGLHGLVSYLYLREK